MRAATHCRADAHRQPDWSRARVRFLLVAALACVTMTLLLAASPSHAAPSQTTTTSGSTTTTAPASPGASPIGANCQFVFVFVYSVHVCKVNTRSGCFAGEGGGLSLFGFGQSFGHLFVKEQNIFQATERFQANILVAYTNVNFLDAESRVLGHFHGGGFPDLNVGVHGGAGRWMGNCPVSGSVPAGIPHGISRVK